MKAKKGFTLVELLAIIVVLAVLAIVAVPVLTNVIKDSKIKAFQTKIYALESAAETYYDDLILEDEFDVFERGLDGTYALTIDLSDKEQVKKLNIKTFNKGMLTITEDGDISITAIEDNYCGQKLHSSNVVNMLNIKEDFTCYLLNSSSGDLGTQDILSAIQNLKSDVEDLKTENKSLKSSNEDLKESIKNLSDNGIGSITALNKIYPVGSIYVSTTLKNAEEVENALGGKWESYGDGRVLRGTTGTSGQTGGLSDVSLTTANLPEHSHSYTPAGSVTLSNTTHTHTVTPKGTVASTFTGSSVTTGNNSKTPSASFAGTTANTGNNNKTPSASFTGHSSTTSYSSLSGSFTMHNAASYTGIHGVGGIVGSGHTNSNAYFTPTSVGGTPGAASIGTVNINASHDHTVTAAGSVSLSNTSHVHSYTPSGSVTLSNTTHTHTVTPKGTVASTFTGSSVTTGNNSKTPSASFTGTASTTGKTGSNTAFSVLDPYITVYMYKRVS